MMNFKIYFMRKRLLFILPYLICVMAGLGLGYCVFEVNRGKAKQQATKIITNEGEVYEKLYFKRSAEYGYVPEERVRRISKGLIPDAKTALNVAINVWEAIDRADGYETDVLKPYKYTVKLINETVWSIDRGTPGALGGGRNIKIQKSDGRILNIMFYK